MRAFIILSAVCLALCSGQLTSTAKTTGKDCPVGLPSLGSPWQGLTCDENSRYQGAIDAALGDGAELLSLSRLSNVDGVEHITVHAKVVVPGGERFCSIRASQVVYPGAKWEVKNDEICCSMHKPEMVQEC